MQGICVSEFGGPKVLQFLKNLPIPKAFGKQVLVSVKAAGVNPVDTYIRNGTHSLKPNLPYIPGKDGGGIVHSVGENVTKVKEGDKVWFWGSATGSYAEYCLCDDDKVGHLPDGMTFEDGAMLGTPYLTAYRALHLKGNVKCGETVLVHGATGGVGIAALQLCKTVGANVIATAGSSHGEQMLRDMGIDKIYNHRDPGYIDKIASGEGQIDIILEMLANVNLENDMKIIGHKGRIVIIGCRGSIEINPRLLMGKESSVIGCALFKSTSDEAEETQKLVQEKVNAGLVKPILWKTVDLGRADEAHIEIIENSGSKGQIVLKIDS